MPICVHRSSLLLSVPNVITLRRNRIKGHLLELGQRYCACASCLLEMSSRQRDRVFPLTMERICIEMHAVVYYCAQSRQEYATQSHAQCNTLHRFLHIEFRKRKLLSQWNSYSSTCDSQYISGLLQFTSSRWTKSPFHLIARNKNIQTSDVQLENPFQFDTVMSYSDG